MSDRTGEAGRSFLGLIGDAVGGWDRFWFSRMDPATLGWMRLCCGLLTFYVHLTYSWGLLGYVGPDAWVNHELAGEMLRDVPYYVPVGGWEERYVVLENGNYYWSVFYHVTDVRAIVALHVLFLASMLLFSAGFLTRLTGALSWAGAMCYVQRANSTVFGLDTMMMILLLYLNLAPSGARYSLDRLIEKWRARRAGLPEPEVPPSYAANFVVRMMQVHFCIIYLAGGTSKLLGSTWWSGTALNLVMLNGEFAPMSNPAYLWLMRSLAKTRWLWETAMGAGIVFTLAMELSFAFLVWDRRWRWVMICGSVALHLGIGLFMGLTTFSLMMMIFVCSFVPPETVRRVIDGLLGRVAPLLRGGAKASSGKKGELVMSR